MKSMTGYGFSSTGNKEFKTFISVKSVNSRFMYIKYYIPSFYSALESEFQKIIFQKVTRGQFFIHVNRTPQHPPSSFVLKKNKDQAKKWKGLYEYLSKELKIKNNFNVTDIMNRAGVVDTIEMPTVLSKGEKLKIKMAFQQALSLCLKEREREGSALKKVIFNLIKSIQFDLQEIKKIHSKQQKDIQNKNVKNQQDSNSLEKLDMTEEIVRMEEHLKHFKDISQVTRKPIGKKLDFYTQEILREINTIGSKSQISKITRHVVEIKSTLEQIKEQVQNIE